MGNPRVRLLGFDQQKTAEVRRLLPGALQKIERIAGRPLKFPSPVLPMRSSEMGRSGDSVQDGGHIGTAGRSVWDPKAQEVRVNPFSSADDILLSVVRELMHATLSDKSEEEIDRLADEVIQGLRLTERSTSVTLIDKISEGLTPAALKRLRKLNRGKDLPRGKGEAKYLPGLTGNKDDQGYVVPTTYRGHPGFGTAVGGIIRHS